MLIPGYVSDNAEEQPVESPEMEQETESEVELSGEEEEEVILERIQPPPGGARGGRASSVAQGSANPRQRTKRIPRGATARTGQ